MSVGKNNAMFVCRRLWAENKMDRSIYCPLPLPLPLPLPMSLSLPLQGPFARQLEEKKRLGATMDARAMTF